MHRNARLLIALLVGFHLFTALSIVREPWDVATRPETRSFVWPLFHDAVHKGGPGVDFFALYHAGLKTSRHENPYEYDETPRRTPAFYPYRYMPAVAATVGRLLAQWEPRAAYLVWVALLEALLATFLVLLTRLSTNEGPFGARFVLAAVALGCLSTPFWLEIYMGQFTFVAITAAMIALLLLDGAETESPSRTRVIFASIAFAAAVELKVFPLVIAPAFLRLRRGYWVVVAAVASVALLDLPIFLRTPGLFRQFLSLNFENIFVGLDPGNHGLLYSIFRLGLAVSGQWAQPTWRAFTLVWQVILLGLTAVLVTFSRARSRVTGPTLALAHLLSYVHVWEHHYSGALTTGLVLALGLVAEENPRDRRRFVAAAVIALVVLALPTTFYFEDPAKDPFADPAAHWGALAFLMPPLCKVLPAVVLYALGLFTIVRSGFTLPFWWPRRKRVATLPAAT